MPPSKKKRGKAAGRQVAADEQLVAATEKGDRAVVARLLAAGADPNALVTVDDASGKAFQTTLLNEASEFGHLEVARLLLDGGADPSRADSGGITPLMICAAPPAERSNEHERLEVLRLLLDAGADPSSAGSAGYTPLMVAAVGGHAEVLRLLLARGAAVDAVFPETGNTAFHSACFNNRPDSVEALVHAGCDVGITNTGGETGRQIAEAQGHTAVVERLRVALDFDTSVLTRLESDVSFDTSVLTRLEALDAEQLRAAQAGTPPVEPGPSGAGVGEVQTNPADVPALPDAEAGPNAVGAAEQEPDGGEAAAKKQLEPAHGTADSMQQPLNGAWYSVALWSWKSEIAVVVLVCFILVSRQRAAGRVETWSGTQREREAEACVVCMEPYSAAGGVVPRMLVTCGHAFCEACLDRMLGPLALKKGRKRLPCPTCRKECAVKGGRVAELPTVYDMMGA